MNGWNNYNEHIEEREPEAMLDKMVHEVMDLQKVWIRFNTPEMERRGQLIRHEIAGFLTDNLLILEKAIPGIHDLSIQGRDATGNKNQIPWVRIYSRELSPNAQTGWYVVYLFDRDGEDVYLCLSHGSTVNVGTSRGIPEFRALPTEDASKLMAWARSRLDLHNTTRPGYTTTVRLGGSSYLARAYESTCVGAIKYSRDNIPDDETLISDIQFMLALLDRLYAADAEDPAIPGKRSPEIQEAIDNIEQSANPAAKYSHQGFRLSAAEKKAVELHAMQLAEHKLTDLGYTNIRDISRSSSCDFVAQRDGQEYLFEVKGTTSAGETILLTRNEVRLHLESYPLNGLIVVSHIELTERGENPCAAQGKVTVHIPWMIDTNFLQPLGYEYRIPE